MVKGRKELVNVLADVLKQVCQRSDRILGTTNITHMTNFHAMRTPPMSIKSYIKHIEAKCCCSKQVFLLALIYIRRLIRSTSYFIINSRSIHRIIITSIMIGAKFYDEPVISNAYFAYVGDISCKEINILEIEFLFRIRFDLSVQINLYNAYNTFLTLQVQPLEEGDALIWPQES